MRILKRILLAIMVMCLCASAGISLAFAEGESSAEGYTGIRYTVTGGAAGGQPLWFGNATPVNYAEAGTEVNIEYTVKTNAMSGDVTSGLCRVFKELGNCWFNTAGVGYCTWNDGYNWQTLFEVGATYKIRFYNLTAVAYSFSIIKTVGGADTDITSALSTTATWYNYGGTGYFGIGILNFAGTFEFDNVAIYNQNGTNLGITNKDNTISTVVATEIKPEQPGESESTEESEKPEEPKLPVFDEVEYNGGTYTVTNSGFLSTLYFGNKTAVPAAAGTKVFLEYEVESASTGATQWGMAETSTPSAQFAFTGGAMKFANGKACQLLEAGASYKYEWSVTESGVTIKGLKTSADGTLTDIVAHLDAATGDLVANAYYGLWLSEGNTGEFKLVNVKCYDGEGKDLGFISNQGSVGATKDGETEDVVFDDVEYKSVLTYDIILNADPIFFGNKTAVTTEVGTKVFIEYKVASAGNTGSAQYGFVATSDPTYLYPFADGRGTLAYQNTATQFNMEGATYKFEFIVTESGVDVKALRITAGGVKTDLSKEFESFASLVANGHYGLWQSAGAIWGSRLVDCKCYDGEGNDLGFATQQE